ncbi:MAG TPA: hypothetical protein PLT66_08575, partial [Bacillota bacterium]|nr:hypothetical protein [Bacillota bacterium]
MKRFSRIMLCAAMLALLISLAAIPASAANDTAYIKITSAVLTVRFDGADLTAGETYTISLKRKVEDIEANGGFAYYSWYEFVSADNTVETFGDNLGQWLDCDTATEAGDWEELSHDFTLGSNCGHLRVQIGFNIATGAVCFDDITIKDSAGNVVFSEDWEDGLDNTVWSEMGEYTLVNYTTPVESTPGQN